MKKEEGFTLIELLVSVAIFSIIIGMASGFFVSALRAQRRILSTQELLDQTSYVLEYMGRALRMAKKDLSGNCLTTAGAKYNYENPGGVLSSIRFIDYNTKCHQFSFEGGQIVERKSTDSSAANLPATSTPLTSTKLQINSLKFNLSGAAQPPTDNLQPRVTIFLEILGRGTGTDRPKIQIQTSISQRNLDFPY